MIEGIHKHLLSELDRAGRSDTIFVLAGVSFNLLVLLINWVQAISIESASAYDRNAAESQIIFAIFLVGALVVSTACLLTLTNSRNICIKCHAALLQIYEDTEVAKYMPEGIGALGKRKFILSFIVVGGTGLLAVGVPLVVIFAA